MQNHPPVMTLCDYGTGDRVETITAVAITQYFKVMFFSGVGERACP